MEVQRTLATNRIESVQQEPFLILCRHGSIQFEMEVRNGSLKQQKPNARADLNQHIMIWHDRKDGIKLWKMRIWGVRLSGMPVDVHRITQAGHS